MQATNAMTGGLVKAERLFTEGLLPLVVQPAAEGVDLAAWAGANRARVEEAVLKHGAVLFRDFGLDSVGDFERFTKAASGGAMEYRERSSPRHEVGERVYTSTDYPADQTIFPHNEHSYSRTVPLKLLFFCLTPARQGGATPIADCRRVLRRISPRVRERFAERGWMYVRNFGDGFGLPWQTVFGTTDRSAVEDYCRGNAIECEWKSGDRLRTRQVRPVIARHPRGGDEVWFNHLTFFHVTTLEPMIRDVLLASFPEADLPNNTYYGDGSPVEQSVLDELREAYLRELVSFTWRRGDVLLIDNMLTAHARSSFEGPRRVVVSMSDPFTRDDV